MRLYTCVGIILAFVFIMFDRSDVQLVYIISVLKVNTTVCDVSLDVREQNTIQYNLIIDTHHTLYSKQNKVNRTQVSTKAE